MVKIMSNSGHVSYGIKEFVIDTEKDVDNLPVDVATGSVALCIETSAVYMINSKGEWKEI